VLEWADRVASEVVAAVARTLAVLAASAAVAAGQLVLVGPVASAAAVHQAVRLVPADSVVEMLLARAVAVALAWAALFLSPVGAR
jgi:hypothetical protein